MKGCTAKGRIEKLPALTVTINLTDAELDAFNFLAMAYDETRDESAESYIKQGIRKWIDDEDVRPLPRAERLGAIFRKEEEERVEAENAKRVASTNEEV